MQTAFQTTKVSKNLQFKLFSAGQSLALWLSSHHVAQKQPLRDTILCRGTVW